MNEPKFSQGPWYPVQEREHDETQHGYFLPKWKVYDHKKAWPIASLGSTWPTEEEEDANAFLIAASPDMYDELEKTASFLRFVAKWIEGQHGVIAIGESLKYKAEIIDKLLAKARGEEEHGK